MPLDPLPDTARLWLFAADRDLAPEEQARLLERVRAFTSDWRSHGRAVAAAAEWLEGRVLAVGGAISPEELNAGVSGCGIDAMTRAVEAAAEAANVRWLSPLDVLWRDADGTTRATSRAAFRQQASAGAVTAETPVFDLTPETIGALRQRGPQTGGLVRPAAEAWHGRAFGLAASVAPAA